MFIFITLGVTSFSFSNCAEELGMFIFITLGVTSFSFSNSTEELGNSLKIRMTSHLCNKYEHTTLSYLLSVNCPYVLSQEKLCPVYMIHWMWDFCASKNCSLFRTAFYNVEIMICKKYELNY